MRSDVILVCKAASVKMNDNGSEEDNNDKHLDAKYQSQ